MDIVESVSGIPIRLTAERWLHIVENHDDIAGYYDEVLATVSSPEVVLPGNNRSKIAVQSFGRRRYLCVIYREISKEDGFIITAYFIDKIDRTKAIWKRQ